LAALTSRERGILRLIDAGVSNKEIAQRLGIVVSTVKNHVHHILNKTRATRRAQAVAGPRDGASAVLLRSVAILVYFTQPLREMTLASENAVTNAERYLLLKW
jgi:DNA-binding CsgD family transcriptional regulator